MTTDAVADDSGTLVVAEALRDAAAKVSEPAAKVRSAVADAGPRALRAVSRATYTGSYVFAYGIVYAAVFFGQSLDDNPLTNGLRDGGRAARDALRRD